MNYSYNNLSCLPKEEVLQILHDCVEILGVVSMKDYAEMNTITKRAAIDRCQKTQTKCFEFDGRKYPCVNIFT